MHPGYAERKYTFKTLRVNNMHPGCTEGNILQILPLTMCIQGMRKGNILQILRVNNVYPGYAGREIYTSDNMR